MTHDGWRPRIRLIAALVACLAAVSHAARPAAQSSAQDAFAPERMMADVRTYYGFGIHRTAHPGDQRTTQWLADRFRRLGLETSEQRWPLRQFFLDEASLEDAQGRLHAFPLWLPRATPAAGLRARLVLVDASTPAAAIKGAIAWLQPAESGPPTRQVSQTGSAGLFAGTPRR